MIRKPDFITFTGAGDDTDIGGMFLLAKQYRIEWGILLSPERQGFDPRYPENPMRFPWWRPMRLAAHLCGAHATTVVERAARPQTRVNLTNCSRIQVNHAAPVVRHISSVGRSLGVRCIAQTRGDAFPGDDAIDWLFDCSGGRGIRASAWPKYPKRLVGYAGGINPDNVLAVLAEIDADGPYWIDMESGVRTDNRFDLELCRRVCEAVYGKRNAAVECLWTNY